jgi:hypothetical protein
MHFAKKSEWFLKKKQNEQKGASNAHIQDTQRLVAEERVKCSRLCCVVFGPKRRKHKS